MALIACPDCTQQVSSNAPTCPKCGAPIATRAEIKAVGTPVQTVQGTSKNLKGQQLMAAFLACVGAVMWVAAYSDGRGGTGFGAMLTLGGLLWFFIVRVRTWWHHA